MAIINIERAFTNSCGRTITSRVDYDVRSQTCARKRHIGYIMKFSRQVGSRPCNQICIFSWLGLRSSAWWESNFGFLHELSSWLWKPVLPCRIGLSCEICTVLTPSLLTMYRAELVELCSRFNVGLQFVVMRPALGDRIKCCTPPRRLSVCPVPPIFSKKKSRRNVTSNLAET